jgi:alpha-beta hydrolase superfamily lysophospholipase
VGSRWRKWLWGAFLAAAISFAGFAGSAWWLAGTFIASANHPVVMPPDFPAEAVSIPGDGRAIAGSWRDLGNHSPVVLLVHGAGGDRRSSLPRARLMLEAGFSVLLIDLQAHGETPGDRITFGWRESVDVRAARDWIQARAPGRRIAAVGASLGGAAILLGEQPSGFDAVVVEATYGRLRDAIVNRMVQRAGIAGYLLSPLMAWQVGPRLGVDVDALQPARAIAGLGAPVLVVGGSRDAYTPEEESRALFAAAREPKLLWIVPGASHQDFAHFDPEGYRAHVIGFLRANLSRARESRN